MELLKLIPHPQDFTRQSRISPFNQICPALQDIPSLSALLLSLALPLLPTYSGWQGEDVTPYSTPTSNTCKELREGETLPGACRASFSLYKILNSFCMRTWVHLLAIIVPHSAGLPKQKHDSPHFGQYSQPRGQDWRGAE